MLVGLILVAAAVVAAVELILANGQAVTLRMWHWTWHLDMWGLAVTGAVILAVGLLGLGMMRISTVRMYRLRREHRALAAENRRLAARAEAVDSRDGDILEPTGPPSDTAYVDGASSRVEGPITHRR